jgi:hypothetical protein
MRKGTADARTIIEVLRSAKVEGLTLPAAVDAYRRQLRAGISAARARRVNARSELQRKVAERHLKRLLNQSARVRRLQRTYPSWQGDLSLAGVVKRWEEATTAAQRAEKAGRSERHCAKLWKLVWAAEDAMRRAGI